MHVERQGKTAIIAATVAAAYRHGFVVVIGETPASATDWKELS
ncbi:Uncharacterised protein [Mycobacteroides abscessus subsp. abscessus]|nr:hypothetical protein [Mycobacteroides abscessus]SIC58752.1 Uncharacterised protein [Mycobacteroides abscessus subsp. abscessus]SIC90026.1 Uncharacterised protein [Mycobacteroides abscessus subsp. abscessus]SID10118.1 Uncharacterised protein [Mycobacteroides abscessus subsp. abscessus]SID18856.1 Uncharacterised protein [Mycobacteroides abscessus subsp. abscessus]SKT53609.1 Uncharacterised protein [Mycobacteroides abscessus subsp. abscessus]